MRHFSKTFFGIALLILALAACIIRDATACCAQGIEFVPLDESDCPLEGDDVTVTGVFSTYYEGPDLYCTLLDAQVE